MMRKNCLQQHIIERKIEGGIQVTGRKGGRRKQLLRDIKEKRGYWKKLKVEVLDLSLWRTRFGTGCGPVVGQTME
jgi:hypothetical protein